MYILIIIILLFLLILVARKPEYGILATLIIASFGTVFDSVVGSSLKFAAIAVIFLFEFVNGIRRKYLSKAVMLYMFLAFTKETLALLNGVQTSSFMIAVYVYVIIFGITYLSFKEIQRKKNNFWNQYLIYIILCLIVQYYRAIFDFTFFGLANLRGEGGQYEDLYSYGGELFRPSSLQGCIVYAIELSVFMGILLLKDGIKKNNILIFLLCAIGLILTYSRSGLLVFAVAILYYFHKQKKFSFSTLILFGAFVYLAITLGFGERLQESTDLGSDTYLTRFGSIITVWNKISTMSLKEYLFGLGYGMANYVDESGDIVFYVEDYYLSLIINSGIITTLAFIIFSFRNIKIGLKQKVMGDEAIMLLMILVVNLLACSMLSYTVQILFWYLSFSIIEGSKEKTRLLKMKTDVRE